MNHDADLYDARRPTSPILPYKSLPPMRGQAEGLHEERFHRPPPQRQRR